MASAHFVFYFCFVCFVWFWVFFLNFVLRGWLQGQKSDGDWGRLGMHVEKIQKESIKVKYILKNEINKESMSVSTTVRKLLLISITYLSIYVYICHN